MKKIVFGITSLTLGGAERVLVDLVNALSKNEEYNISIFTLYGNGELEKQVSSKVRIESLMKENYTKLTKLTKLIIPIKVLLLKSQIYKKYIYSNYDIEIAFLEGPITRIFSKKNKSTKKIAWVHNDISQVFGRGIKAKIKTFIDKKNYSMFNKIVFVSEDNLDKFSQIYNLNNEKVLIRNYIDSETIIKKSKDETRILKSEELNFVTVVRLVKQKRVDRLIQVHSELLKKGLMHHIYVIGDGPEKKYLIDMIENNNLKNTFHLLGKKENPYPYIKESDYFVLFSEFEGYGMVLEEAKILNKPIIITDTAAREAIQDYRNGIIVKNTEKSIYEIMEEKIKLGKNIPFYEQEYDNKYLLQKVIKLIES